MKLPLSKPRLGVLAAVLGGGSALALVAAIGPTGFESTTPLEVVSSDDSSGGSSDDISGPCDEAEHANDPRCAGVSVPAAPPDAPATTETAATGTTAPGSDVRSLPTIGGTVSYTVDATLAVVNTVPASGWSTEVEQASGRELEVDFRSGTRRVQVNIELEDGQVRERVRIRDDADDSEIRVEDGVVVRQEPDDDHDEHSGNNSGPGSDNSGSGSGHDDEDSGRG
jgi:hypothetical protein